MTVKLLYTYVHQNADDLLGISYLLEYFFFVSFKIFPVHLAIDKIQVSVNVNHA